MRLCRAEDSVLLLVDIQERLLHALPPQRRHGLLHQVQVLLNAAERLGVPILATAQYPAGLGAVLPEISSRLPEAPAEKTCFSCCRVPAIGARLGMDTRRAVVLAGVEAHVCVLQTALELQEQGLHPFVVEDAVASRNPAHEANALSRLRQAGVVVSNTESVLFEWLGDAAHPAFRDVSRLVR